MVDDGFLHRVHLQEVHRGQRSFVFVGQGCQSAIGLFVTVTVYCCLKTLYTHTHSRTMLKFEKSPTGDIASIGNDRNCFIVNEVLVLSPAKAPPTGPAKAPPTVLHPLPTRERRTLML